MWVGIIQILCMELKLKDPKKEGKRQMREKFSIPPPPPKEKVLKWYSETTNEVMAYMY